MLMNFNFLHYNILHIYNNIYLNVFIICKKNTSLANFLDILQTNTEKSVEQENFFVLPTKFLLFQQTFAKSSQPFAQ